MASSCKSNSVCSLAAMSWQRLNIGSRMNREVHVRFWERAGVANTMTVNPIAAGLLATQLVGEPITLNLLIGLVAVFAGMWIATTETRKL